MTEVGIRELKADLSEYLRRAAAGEPIRVTMRGEPFVDLVAARPAASADDVVSVLDRLADSGLLSHPANPGAPRVPSRRLPLSAVGGRSLSDEIIEERERERQR